MIPRFKVILAAAACVGLAWPAPFLAAQESGAPAVAAQVERLAAPLIAKIGPAGITLRSLLADGFEIINVDAPAGTLAARFILRKGLDVYSCEQAIYREGGAQGNSRVIVTPCHLLTPNE